MKKPIAKPHHRWGENLIKAMDARGISVPDLARTVYPNDEPARAALVDKIHQWRRGEVDKPRGTDLESVAAVLGTTELRLRANRSGDIALLERPAADTVNLGEQWSGEGNGNDSMPNGIKVELSDLDPEWARRVRAAIGDRTDVEVWQLTSDVLMIARYLNEQYLVVDLKQRPKSNDIVLAYSRGVPIFRQYLRPVLISLELGGGPVIPVDNRETVIRGVVLPPI